MGRLAPSGVPKTPSHISLCEPDPWSVTGDKLFSALEAMQDNSLVKTGETQVTDSMLRMLFADVFAIEPDQVTDTASPETLDSWDSFGHMRLIMTIEERLGIVLNMDQVLDIDCYGALRNTILDGMDRQ
jgi:acyl carrier protein